MKTISILTNADKLFLYQGGVSTEATLTAFVAVSLMESGMSPQVG